MTSENSYRNNKLKFDRLTLKFLKFSIIGISETWLSYSDHNVHIPGYEFLHNPRVSRSGGGVGLYLADSLNFKVRRDVNFSDEWTESLFVEIIQK